MSSFPVPQLDIRGKSFSLQVPSSKSMANRALVLAAQTRGSFHLQGDFAAEDVQLMIQALRHMGLAIQEDHNGLQIHNDLSWRQNAEELELFLGNSGTSLRFLATLVAFRKGSTILTGVERMKERPIEDLADALVQLGVKIEYLERQGFPPIRVTGSEAVKGGKVKIKGNVSSQFLTSLLLSASSFEHGLKVHIVGDLISRPYVEMTIAQINEWGGRVSSGKSKFEIQNSKFVSTDREIEGDASAAVYWWALGFLHDCHVTVTNVPETSVQGDLKFRKVLDYLKRGGACGPKGFEIDMNSMPDASLMLMALGPLLSHPITITGIASLRIKETDRIQAMANELKKIGAQVQVGPDWMRISPLDHKKSLKQSHGKISIETYDDHRVAMSMAILGTKLGNLEILHPECVRKTYPGFWHDLSLFH